MEPWDGHQGFVVRTVLLRAKEFATAKKQPPIITSSADIAKICKWLENTDQEHVCVVCLSGQNTLTAVHDTSAGGINSAFIEARQIARVALLVNSQAVVLVHNHPSGEVTPSEQDIKMTMKVRLSLQCFDIQLLDHIIIGAGKHYSFLDRNLLTIE